ncbi:MAG: ATP-dependent Clp protease proteolytic subunit [Planctomycetaceae bacterium]
MATSKRPSPPPAEEGPPASRIQRYPAVAAGLNGDRPPPRDWEVVLSGDLTDKQADLVEKLAEVPRNSRGTIYFDSCGGNVFVGLSLATLIRLRGLDPMAVVAGECSSAALLPFAACRRRFVTAHSTLLFHPMRWHSEENVKLEEAAEWARQFRVLETDMDQLLARMFELPLETIQSWSRPGRFLSGVELARAGVAQLVDLFSGDLWTQARHSSDENSGVGGPV